jgi:hypothetical protein
VVLQDPVDSSGVFIGGGRRLYAVCQAALGHVEVGFSVSEGLFLPGQHDCSPKAAFSTADFARTTKREGLSEKAVFRLDEVCRELRDAPLGFSLYRTTEFDKAVRYAALLNGGDISEWREVLTREVARTCEARQLQRRDGPSGAPRHSA